MDNKCEEMNQLQLRNIEEPVESIKMGIFRKKNADGLESPIWDTS